QSVCGSFFRGASSGYYDVPAGEELWKLFLVIALNKIRAKGAYHRAAKRDVRLTVGGDCLGQTTRAVARSDVANPVFLKMVVAEALERLPPRHKDLVELRIEGYEVAEIAEIAGRSKRTVERLLQEARKLLGNLLAEV